jgi:pimeloyl-ACP methyl ester carboxylesterase
VKGFCAGYGIAQLAVTRQDVQDIKTPVRFIVGEHDPCRRLYVAPLEAVRPDWPVRTVPGAGHLDCILKPAEFKTDLETALAGQPKN